MGQYDLSVIIPCLNEGQALPHLLAQLKHQQNVKLQVIVVDGGSTDDTLRVAHRFQTQIVHSPKGRGKQMNAGVKIAESPFLLFLHADCQLDRPDFMCEALKYFKEALLTNIHLPKAGHFQMEFTNKSPRHTRAYRYMEEKTFLTRRYSVNGDQGLLIEKNFFQRLNGFDETFPFFEDQEIADKIFMQGQWVLLPGILQTSARRFEQEGVYRRYILMSIMMGLYWTGLKSFFQLAPQVYRLQQDTHRLKLMPFYRTIFKILKEDLGFKGSCLAWYRVGRYVRQNSWQLFYYFDIWLRPVLGPRRYPFTLFHDKIFYPLTDNRVFDGINTILCVFWFLLILPSYFTIVEEWIPKFVQLVKHERTT